jgi:hypothetical protein
LNGKDIAAGTTGVMGETAQTLKLAINKDLYGSYVCVPKEGASAALALTNRKYFNEIFFFQYFLELKTVIQVQRKQ